MSRNVKSALLETKGLTIRFGGLAAVNELDLTVQKGEIVALIGPNGAGKTTVFNMLTGVYKPTAGEVRYDGERIDGLRPDKIAKQGVSRTFQNIRLFKSLSVLDNVLLAGHMHHEHNLLSAVLRTPKVRREERALYEKAMNLLEETGLADQADDVSTSLPYGKQRRLEIARALATDPKLLLLDEPAAGMNPRESEDLTHFVRSIRDQYDLTVFLIEHHMQIVMDISDHIYVLDYGQTIADGRPAEIQSNEKVIRAYLGETEE